MAFGFSESTNDPMNPDGPATIERRRRLAEALIQQGTSGAPIKSWTEGVSNIAKAMMGGYDMRQADAAERDGRKSSTDQTSALVKALMGEPAAISPSSAAPTPSTAMTTADATGARGRGGVGNFDTSMERTFQFEGGMNPRDTNGTPSNFGINQQANPDVNVAGLTQDSAKGLYKSRYWDTIDGDKLPPAVAHVAFDTSVIAGPGKAKELLAAAGGDPMKMLDLRKQFQDSLIARDPAKYGPYANAWNKRIEGLRADIASAGGQAQRAVSAAPLAYAAAPTATASDAAPVTMPTRGAPGPLPQPVQSAPLPPPGSPDAPMAGRPGMGGSSPILPAGGFSGGQSAPPERRSLVDALMSSGAASPDGVMSGATIGGPRVAGPGGAPQAIANASPASASTGVSRAAAGFIPEIDQPHTTSPAQIAAGGAAAAPARGQALAQALMPPQPQPPAQSAPLQPAAPAGPAGDQRALGLAMQIFQNPWADAGQKQIATTILSKQLSAGKVTTVDLGDRVALMNERGQVQGYLPKQRDADWEPVKDGSGNMVGRFNKRSGQSEALPNALGDAAKAPSVQRVKQPDGSEVAVQWDERQKVWLPLNAPGGGNAVQSTLPKLTEGQGKDVGFLQRGLEANKALTPAAEKALMDTADTVAQNFPTIMGVNPARAIQKDEFKTAHNSARNFLAVILRKDTGAAISKEEWGEYTPLFIPQPNDTAALIQQKRQNRETAMTAIKDGLGNVGEILDRVMAARKAPGATPAPAPSAGAQPAPSFTPDEIAAELQRRGIK